MSPAYPGGYVLGQAKEPPGAAAAKARALQELAVGVSSGLIDLGGLRAVDDDDAMQSLTALRGVGPWSAQMFLIHRLHRPDILPAGDVGIRHAVHSAYDLVERPSESAVAARATAWAQHRSYASVLLRTSVSGG